ncbi:hypothetical protein C8R46DRAFT_1342259 [Mycena filopes]|nr:hypothetical protein C8R46DRAFT_1342259 [Mycena filopes]
MVSKRSEKQSAHSSTLSNARWRRKDPAKENIIPNNLIPPRATTRAPGYVNPLEATVTNQQDHILQLQTAYSHAEDHTTLLTTQLEQTTSRIQSLELETDSLATQLANANERLDDAYDTISSQAEVIKQKNQRIHRLMRDKAVLSAKIATLKQELLLATLSAAESDRFSNATASHIESLIQSIDRLTKSVAEQKAAKHDLYKDLRATRKREQRSKALVKQLKEKKKWSGMKGLDSTVITELWRWRPTKLDFTPCTSKI